MVDLILSSDGVKRTKKEYDSWIQTKLRMEEVGLATLTEAEWEYLENELD